MNSGFAYASVPIYRLVMRLLYRSEYHRKYQAVADLIPANSSVVDLCAGDCALAARLTRQSERYLGLELNPRFVIWARRAGINAKTFDLSKEEIPAADVICLQSSLYQFIPHDEQIVQRMIDRARQLVIISEPVVNLATSSNSLVSRIAARATRVDGRAFRRRHTLETLTALLTRVAPHAELIERQSRDAIFVIRKARHEDLLQ